MTLSARLYALYRRLSGRPLPVCDRCREPITGGYWWSMDSPARHWHPECGNHLIQEAP
jgi:hypothetical protein